MRWSLRQPHTHVFIFCTLMLSGGPIRQNFLQKHRNQEGIISLMIHGVHTLFVLCMHSYIHYVLAHKWLLLYELSKDGMYNFQIVKRKIWETAREQIQCCIVWCDMDTLYIRDELRNIYLKPFVVWTLHIQLSSSFIHKRSSDQFKILIVLFNLEKAN